MILWHANVLNNRILDVLHNISHVCLGYCNAVILPYKLHSGIQSICIYFHVEVHLNVVIIRRKCSKIQTFESFMPYCHFVVLLHDITDSHNTTQINKCHAHNNAAKWQPHQSGQAVNVCGHFEMHLSFTFFWRIWYFNFRKNSKCVLSQ